MNRVPVNPEPDAPGLPAPEEAHEAAPRPRSDFPSDDTRFRALADEHLDFTWRSLRRLGLPADVADDATQRVFLVASQKLASIRPGRERAFLFQAAVRVASSEKRTFARRREQLRDHDGDDHDRPDEAAGADEHRARAILDDLLEELDMDLRTVFVLYELEGMTTADIGVTLGVPRGTAASRLRRAREAFRLALKRHQARTSPGPRRT
jgi:RNA polymerase sigma-70 factor (ECF subfamily)